MYPSEKPEQKFVDGNGETAQERVAKLVYSQLKISVMERDNKRNLKLEKDEIEEVEASIQKAHDAALAFVNMGVERAMNFFN